RVHRRGFDVEADAQRAALLRIGRPCGVRRESGGSGELQERAATHCRGHRVPPGFNGPAEYTRRPLRLRRVARSSVVVVGAGFAMVIVGMALFAGTLAPHAPDEQNFDLIEAKPSVQAFFGTDRFGRDVLSRVIYGARVSLYVAVTSIGLAMITGGTLG